MRQTVIAAFLTLAILFSLFSQNSSASKLPVGSNLKSLIAANQKSIASLASISADVPEITLLRFALQFPNDADAQSALRDTERWRQGKGRYIVESAAAAVAAATASGG